MAGVNYTRTTCPVCGTRFTYGVTIFHYRAAHPEFAAWTSRWFKILFLIYVPAVVVVLVLADWLAPTFPKNTIFVSIVLAYFLGGLAIMMIYRFFVERSFRRHWNNPEWRVSHQNELNNINID